MSGLWWNCPASRFCLVGGRRLAPGHSRKHRGKGRGFDSNRGAPVRHILFDVDDDNEDNEHEEDYKDDEGDDD